MENNIISRLTKLQEHIQRYNQLLSQLNKETKSSFRQSLILQLSSTKKRIERLKTEIQSIVYAPIIEITYGVSDNIYHARLANMSKSEAMGLINLLAQSKGQTVNFLEVREIPTFLCESKL